MELSCVKQWSRKVDDAFGNWKTERKLFTIRMNSQSAMKFSSESVANFSIRR